MLSKKLQTAVLLLLFLSLLSADKISLSKADIQKHKKQKIHPVQQYFEKQSQKQSRRTLDRDVDNRLLVMLIDFEEDNDSSTTGNGKFQYDPGEYLLDLGKPPHDQEYFWWILESVRYYYEAASIGAFNLDFDIYPKHNYTEADTTVVAYTLPHEMAYYNPPGVDTATMVSRFEEYFADVFNTVNEKDSTVVFSDYGHFMILHAGADSQHDIKGDSQSDIPSFFIQIGDGKEVTVDGVVIDHACNVPETISQDDQYGVPNAVIAHEFGHSLGFVDLYSTLTGAPQVGWYDIMDSGGMGELVVMKIDDELITVEGGLPTLPNAWHRILVWEDYLRSKSMLVDIDELDWSEPIRIDPAEKLYSGGRVEHPYFIKVPLTDKEYLLIENRQVDPDGDSGLSFKGALAQTPNAPIDKKYRVLLYPTYPFDDPRENPNWEYDLFLPGWQKEVEEDVFYNYGGGLVIWHIDDRIIYEEGEWEDGEFYSNYDMNTVNALHTHRGVKVIEADGFDNIGNYNNSYNILGSAWDPFFRYQPVLTDDGEFVGWENQGSTTDTLLTNDDQNIHTINFNGLSNPALMSNDGDPGFMGLWDISSYYITLNNERFMTFRYGCHIYDEITVLRNYEELVAVSSPAMIYGLPSVAVVADGKIEVLNQVGDDWDNFLAISFDYDRDITQPIVSYDHYYDGNEEIMLVSENHVATINTLELTEMEFSSALSDAPMLLETDEMAYPLADELMIGDDAIPVPEAKIAWDGEYLIAQNNNSVNFINPVTKDIVTKFNITSGNSDYYPQVFRDEESLNSTVYCINDNGVIWKFSDEMEEVFDSSDYNDNVPSQLLLTPLKTGGATRVVFAAGEKLFALTLSGSLVDGYPVFMEDRAVMPGSVINSLLLKDEVILMLERESGGIMAIDASGKYRQEYSGVLPQGKIVSHFWYDEVNQNLNWFGGDTNGALYNALMNADNADETNPIISSSFRNNNDGMFTGKTNEIIPGTIEFSAYAYPNPARGDYARFRITGALENISFKLYDIAGNLVYNTTASLELNPYQDIRLETSNLASGVYYARIKSGSKMLTTALGVIK